MNTTRARALGSTPTDAKRVLWQQLKRRQLGGFKFRRQQPIGSYVVDFVCFEARRIIDMDGGQHAEHLLADGRRTQWLESQSYGVLRFWNNDVLSETAAVVQPIAEALEVM